MVSIEPSPPAPALAAALRAYERGRVRWAMATTLPLAVFPVLSWVLGGRALSMAVLGTALVALAGLLLWRGQALGRGVGLGLGAGLVPLALSHAAHLYGHVCTASGCLSLCVPACTLGGVAAGLLLSTTRWRPPLPLSTLGAAAAVAFLTGALGCACVGYGGVLGLALGLASTLGAARLIGSARA